MRYIYDFAQPPKQDVLAPTRRLSQSQVSAACEQARHYAKSIFHIDRNTVSPRLSRALVDAWHAFSHQFFTPELWMIKLLVDNAFHVEMRRQIAIHSPMSRPVLKWPRP